MTVGLRELRRRHDGWGVAPEHYPAFRRAFLESARASLGEKHTADVERAWAETIDMITESIRGATRTS
jgi:hemoglobin-like flavoprotein